MECVPSPSAAVLNEAEPLLKGMLPEIGVVPSMNCTAPLPVLGVSVAVNTRLSPRTDGFAPFVNVTTRVLAEVRRSTGLLRGFWNVMGQSLLEVLKGACVSRIVSSPGVLPELTERPYARAISVVPS